MNLVVSCKPQFFVVIIASATNKQTIKQNINFEILILKPKHITELNDQDNPIFCISHPIQE